MVTLRSGRVVTPVPVRGGKQKAEETEPASDKHNIGHGKEWELCRNFEVNPLFVTSKNVTHQLIDKFLTAEFKVHGLEEDDEPMMTCFYLVTKETVPRGGMVEMPEDRRHVTPMIMDLPSKRLSVLPTPPFESPYNGYSVQKILETNRKSFNEYPFQGRNFVVFDERSARDQKTVLLIEDHEEFDEEIGADYMRARCEFGYAGLALCGPNIANSFLYEGIYPGNNIDPERGKDREQVYYNEENMGNFRRSMYGNDYDWQ